MPKSRVVEVRDGVELTNLDQPLSDGSDISKRELIDYLDQAAALLLPGLQDRALSVIRVRPGQQPFMQKNLPKYAPDWIPQIELWSEASHRTVHYPVCEDRRTLLWLANQRAVEFHPALVDRHGRQTQLIVDLDPPEGADFEVVVTVAHAVRAVLTDCGLTGAVKTSGSKGVHIVVPLEPEQEIADVAAATRAIAQRTADRDPAHATVAYVKDEREGKVFVDSTRAGGATVAAAYSPRVRPGLPVSFPVSWSALDRIRPTDFTVRTVPELLAEAGPNPSPWSGALPAAQRLPDDLVSQGHQIPVARVAAMHEGKRRRRAERDESGAS